MDYGDFLVQKTVRAKPQGFAVSPNALHERLFNWQREVVSWALNLGRAALFEERGLGKTIQQIEWARRVHEQTRTRILIVCPLAVAHQTIAEGQRIGVEIAYVRSQDDVQRADTPLVITNYDMAIRDVFDFAAFGGIVLDESSRLKAFTSKTKQFLIGKCADISYKLCCTATPSPNDTVELGNHAEFLDVMTNGEMLTRWFIRDSNKANNLRLKGHAVKDFWNWVTSWALCLSTPADLGYADARYDLPALNLIYELVEVDNARAWKPDKDGHITMFLDANRSATDMWAEKRATVPQRVRRVRELVDKYPDEPLIVWHETNYERDAIAEAVPEALIVHGSQSPAEKEELLNAFSRGEARIIATKPKIAGWGLNWQHCARPIFMSLTHKFEEFYQALGRNHRFGQKRMVSAHLIFAESEEGIVNSLQTKWQAHKEMKTDMVKAMSTSGLAKDRRVVKMSAKVERNVRRGQDWTMYLGDSVEEIRAIADHSVGLSVSSWPFSDQYMYSANLRDFGNSDGDAEFFAQLDYLIPELLRVTLPGRLAIVHAKDRIVYGTKSKYNVAYIEPFTDKCIAAMRKHGWLFFGRIVVTTDVVRENTHTHRLTQKEMRKDGSKMGVGMPEYGLLFRKLPRLEDGTGSVEPVLVGDDYSVARWQLDANSHWRSSGNRLLYPWEQPRYDFAAHVRHLETLDVAGVLSKANMTEPIPSVQPAVWSDIQRTNVLNARMAKAHEDEKHVCPLQLDFIERCITRWSNPRDTVLDYFMGIGSVGVKAIELGRKAIGIELKPEYFEWACKYLAEAEREAHCLTLFDLADLPIMRERAAVKVNN